MGLRNHIARPPVSFKECSTQGKTTSAFDDDDTLLNVFLQHFYRLTSCALRRDKNTKALVKHTADQTSEDQTSEDQTSEDQTSEDQTSEDQTSEDQTSEDQTSEDQTSEANAWNRVIDSLETRHTRSPLRQNTISTGLDPQKRSSYVFICLCTTNIQHVNTLYSVLCSLSSKPKEIVSIFPIANDYWEILLHYSRLKAYSTYARALGYSLMDGYFPGKPITVEEISRNDWAKTRLIARAVLIQLIQKDPNEVANSYLKMVNLYRRREDLAQLRDLTSDNSLLVGPMAIELPTYNGYVATKHDARILLDAYISHQKQFLLRAPHPLPGCVFICQNWEDHIKWTSSSYYEGFRLDEGPGGLVKKTISFLMGGEVFWLVSFYNQADLFNKPAMTPSRDSGFRNARPNFRNYVLPAWAMDGLVLWEQPLGG